MGVSENRGIPKSSFLMGLSNTNQLFLETPTYLLHWWVVLKAWQWPFQCMRRLRWEFPPGLPGIHKNHKKGLGKNKHKIQPSTIPPWLISRVTSVNFHRSWLSNGTGSHGFYPTEDRASVGLGWQHGDQVVPERYGSRDAQCLCILYIIMCVCMYICIYNFICSKSFQYVV